ncbi:hypothetical protein [Roseospira goensis]|uniref:Uncharacterized protein n=1 Tax=Roseospira goensis TaxID=391922 RepID=A0A7W6S2D1_9PROT|nr:hypothetical protein [Roseospira goensis]MBB4287603.1 hypothetical protein [Roseospira goensis]
MSEQTSGARAPASGDPVPGILSETRPRRRMRAGAGLAVGGVSGLTVTAAVADLVIAWWPWAEALPVTTETEGALRTLIIAVGTVALGVLGAVGQAAVTRWTRLGED